MSFNIDLKSYGNKLLSFGIYANVMSERTKACFPRDRTLRTLVISPKMGWARERSKRPIVQAIIAQLLSAQRSIAQFASAVWKLAETHPESLGFIIFSLSPVLLFGTVISWLALCTSSSDNLRGTLRHTEQPNGLTSTPGFSLSLSLCSHPRAPETSYYITKSQMQVLTLFYSLMFKLYPLWKLRRSLEIFRWFVQMLSNSVFANLLLSL